MLKKTEALPNINITYLFFKRFFDIIIGILGLILLIPIIIVIKFSYILSGDFYTIFYTHKRIGKNGKEFRLIKFRTMVPKADKVLDDLLKDPEFKDEWDKSQKLYNDPRITKEGRFLRKTSLDEMPQFINVLLGHMSLVGPRPLVPGELDAHNGNHELYESVRPGITGWWAANGCDNTDYNKRLELEYYYCRNCSFKMDIKCTIKTIKTVFSKKHKI